MSGGRDAQPARATILLADDEAAIRELLQSQLEEAGYEIHAFGDGQSALEYALESPPDLAILDVMMPRKNGWELCRVLKTTEATQSVKIVMLTAVGPDINHPARSTFGADASIDKPFDLNEVLEVVGSLLQGS
jgi:DNA-binding response OmpR family regulator